MTTTAPARYAGPAGLAARRLAERYPMLAGDDWPARCAALLTGYAAPPGGDGADHRQPAVALLLGLADHTGDPGAPAILMLEFVRALDECRLPMPDSRSVQIQVLQDLAQLMRLETGAAAASAEQRAQRDPVTGLPDRHALHRLLLQQLDRAGEAGRALALMCIELRHTHARLDQPGNPSQEDLVRTVVSLLRAPLRDSDVLLRTGTLEFYVVMPGLLHPGLAGPAAHRIAAALGAAPVLLDGQSIALFPAIGIAASPDHGSSPAALIRAARRAADESQSNTTEFEWYSGREQSEAERTGALDREVRVAIDENALELHFQPQLELASGRVVSVEALLRWQRRPDEWVSPEEIIQAANRLNMVGQLSQWILGEALRQVAEWERIGLQVSVGVNLWAKALLEQDLHALVERALTTWFVDPERLAIEITEGEMIEDWERSRDVISRLRALGVTIAMDDFGTGYSHYSWLRDLDIDEIKIDKLFVRDLLHGHRDEPIVRSVIGLAHELELVVVAEGVEDQATQEALARMGCDRIQGFWLSRPLDAERCTAFLRQHAGL